MSIKITKFHPHASGKMVGFIDISVPLWGTNLNIRGCKVFHGQHGDFVSLPSREYKDDSGETKYSNLIGLDDEEIFKKFLGSIKSAWLEYKTTLTEMGSPAPAANDDTMDAVPF